MKTTSPGLIQLLIGHTVGRPIGCLRRLIGQFNFAGAITIKTFDGKNLTDLLHLFLSGALRTLHINGSSRNKARCQTISHLLLLCLLAGCSTPATQPSAITPPTAPVKTIDSAEKILPTPVQWYLNVTCSNSIILPDEYTVYVTNANPAATIGWSPALEVAATYFENVAVPISGDWIFVKAKNQIGQ